MKNTNSKEAVNIAHNILAPLRELQNAEPAPALVYAIDSKLISAVESKLHDQITEFVEALIGLEENGCWCGAHDNRGPHTAQCNAVRAAITKAEGK